jgi:hypothetical protein
MNGRFAEKRESVYLNKKIHKNKNGGLVVWFPTKKYLLYKMVKNLRVVTRVPAQGANSFCLKKSCL